MKRIMLAVLLFVLLISCHVLAFELVEVEDNKDYGLGFEYGTLFKDNDLIKFMGISGSYKLKEKTYARVILGSKATKYGNSDLLVVGKPIYCFKKDLDYKFYGFGLVGNFGEEVSLGAGLGYERDHYLGEIGYTLDQYIYLNAGYNFYF